MKRVRPLNEKSWEPEEMKVIAQHAGKLSLSDIAILVNKVGIAYRTDNAVMKAGNKSGWRFGLKIA